MTTRSVIHMIQLFLLLGLCFSYSPGVKARLTADDAQIVDCLLPGKVKQLGTRRTYLAKKRPAKLSTNECEIRGGEYVKYDRANLSTALNVWQESAMLGDAEAQYYMGEIFEKGVGKTPDFELAFVWYKKSAEQDYQPAMMSLGRLYESGLGVAKDLVKAMNLYRKASGLDNEQIEYASVFRDARLEDQNEIQQLRTALHNEKNTATQLSSQLSTLKRDLNASKSTVKQLEQDIDENKQVLNQGTIPRTEPHVLVLELAKAKNALNTQKTLVTALQSELTIIKSGESSNAFLEKELEKAQATLSHHKQQADEKEQETLRLKTALSELKTTLESQSPTTQLKLVKKELLKEKASLEQALNRAKKQLKQQQEHIANLMDDVKTAAQEPIDIINAYEYQLEQTRQAVKTSQSSIRQQYQHVELLEQEIADLKQKTKDMAPVEQLQALKDTLTEREAFYQSQTALLTEDLEQQGRHVALLKQRIEDTNANSQNKANYAASLEDKISIAFGKIAESIQLVDQKDADLENAYATIDSLEAKIKILPKVEDLKRIEADLFAKQTALEKEQLTTKTLTHSIQQLEEAQTKTTTQLNKVIPEDGPVIALRWPKYDDSQTVKTALVGAGSVVNVVGAVYPVNTIDSFTINGQDETLDESGLFLKTIDVLNEPITLTINAIDDHGRASQTAIHIKPTADGALSYLGGGELTVPKLKFGKFYALIFGNNDYKQQKGWHPLSTAIDDAKAIGEVLKSQYGFDVTVKLNSTRGEMLIALEEMRRKLTEDDNLLVYYAGHGYMDPENDQGYWIPINGSLNSSIEWISNATITDQIRAMTARNVMVIADSCYSGSLMRSGLVSLRSGLSPKKKLQRLIDDINEITRTALSSGGLQPVADAIGNSKHSVFAGALLKILRENKKLLDGDSLATQVGLSVSITTQDNVKQVPRYSPLAKGGHQGGEFYFVPKNWKTNNI